MSTTTTEITRTTLRAITADMQAALAEVAAKYGVSIDTGRATFSSRNATVKVEVAVLGEGGVAVTREVEGFKSHAPLWGLTADDLGRTFIFRGRPYTITGARPRSTKYPIVGTRDDGKVFKFQPESILRGMESR